MIGQFEELLAALGKVFHLVLHIDQSNACSIQIHEGLVIQLQPDLAQENLWLFSKLVEIPPGKFRENVLKEALKANSLPDPRPGVFSYLSQSNHLVLCQKYPFSILDGERLAGLIGGFVEMGEIWQKAIVSGQAAPQTTPPRHGLPNPFGLK